jgi:hypothetical protein
MAPSIPRLATAALSLLAVPAAARAARAVQSDSNGFPRYYPRDASNSTAGAVNTTTCNGKEYVYEELAGYGLVVSDAVDKFGDNLGGLGSSIHIERSSWTKRCNGTYTGKLWALPDRGW